MDDQTLRYWIGFNRIKGIGAARFAALLAYFGDAETAWEASEPELNRALAGDLRACAAIINFRKSADLDRDLAVLVQFNAYAITWHDPLYPPLLRQIANPPPLLYVRGQLTEADSRALSIVGTRTATEYGLRTARQLATALVSAGYTIVSGLAKGIDGAAHAAAIRAGGRTIAFLGHGIDRVYPSEHVQLADQIAANGALLTEFPIGTPPEGGNFPQRNRLISGIARGTIVVEGSLKSGSLGIARLALDQNREVFAVPGPIDAVQSQGVNQLIQAGEAKLIQHAADVLIELGEPDQASALRTPAAPPEAPKASRSRRSAIPHEPIPDRSVPESANVDANADLSIDLSTLVDLDEATRALWQHIAASPTVRLDELGTLSGLPMGQVTASLTLLEMAGFIRQASGQVYALTESV